MILDEVEDSNPLRVGVLFVVLAGAVFLLALQAKRHNENRPPIHQILADVYLRPRACPAREYRFDEYIYGGCADQKYLLDDYALGIDLIGFHGNGNSGNWYRINNDAYDVICYPDGNCEKYAIITNLFIQHKGGPRWAYYKAPLPKIWY